MAEDKRTPSVQTTDETFAHVMKTLIDAGYPEPTSNVDFTIPSAVVALVREAEHRGRSLGWAAAAAQYAPGEPMGQVLPPTGPVGAAADFALQPSSSDASSLPADYAAGRRAMLDEILVELESMPSSIDAAQAAMDLRQTYGVKRTEQPSLHLGHKPMCSALVGPSGAGGACSCGAVLEPRGFHRWEDIKHKTQEAAVKAEPGSPGSHATDRTAPDRKLDEQGDPKREMPGSPVPAEQSSPPAEARESRGATSRECTSDALSIDWIARARGWLHCYAFGKYREDEEGLARLLAGVFVEGIEHERGRTANPSPATSLRAVIRSLADEHGHEMPAFERELAERIERWMADAKIGEEK